MNEHIKREQEAVIKNLQDAGCDKYFIRCFLNYEKSEEICKKNKILSEHRKVLLNKMHEVEKCIDCLDYLVYKLNKEH